MLTYINHDPTTRKNAAYYCPVEKMGWSKLEVKKLVFWPNWWNFNVAYPFLYLLQGRTKGMNRFLNLMNFSKNNITQVKYLIKWFLLL